MPKPHAIVASLFTYGLLIYIAHLLNKPLQPFIPVGVVLLVLAVNAFAFSSREKPHCENPCSRPR